MDSSEKKQTNAVPNVFLCFQVKQWTKASHYKDMRRLTVACLPTALAQDAAIHDHNWVTMESPRGIKPPKYDPPHRPVYLCFRIKF